MPKIRARKHYRKNLWIENAVISVAWTRVTNDSEIPPEKQLADQASETAAIAGIEYFRVTSTKSFESKQQPHLALVGLAQKLLEVNNLYCPLRPCLLQLHDIYIQKHWPYAAIFFFGVRRNVGEYVSTKKKILAYLLNRAFLGCKVYVVTSYEPRQHQTFFLWWTTFK